MINEELKEHMLFFVERALDSVKGQEVDEESLGLLVTKAALDIAQVAMPVSGSILSTMTKGKEPDMAQVRFFADAILSRANYIVSDVPEEGITKVRDSFEKPPVV
jgi:hypothetical protein